MCILGVKDRNPFFLETQDHGRKVKVRHVGEGGGCTPGQGSRQRLTGWQNHGMEPGDGAGSRRRRPPPGQAPGAGRARAWPRGAAPLTTPAAATRCDRRLPTGEWGDKRERQDKTDLSGASGTERGRADEHVTGRRKGRERRRARMVGPRTATTLGTRRPTSSVVKATTPAPGQPEIFPRLVPVRCEAGS